MPDNTFFFSGTLEGLGAATDICALWKFLIFRTTFGFVVNPSDVPIFDDLDREDFDKGELIYMPGEKMLIFLGVEDFFGVTKFV